MKKKYIMVICFSLLGFFPACLHQESVPGETNALENQSEIYSEITPKEKRSRSAPHAYESLHPPAIAEKPLGLSLFMLNPWLNKNLEVQVQPVSSGEIHWQGIPSNQWVEFKVKTFPSILHWRIGNDTTDHNSGSKILEQANGENQVMVFAGFSGKTESFLILPDLKNTDKNQIFLINVTGEEISWQGPSGLKTLPPVSYAARPVSVQNLHLRAKTSGSSLTIDRSSFGVGEVILLILPPLRGERGEFQYRVLSKPEKK